MQKKVYVRKGEAVPEEKKTEPTTNEEPPKDKNFGGNNRGGRGGRGRGNRDY